MAGGRSNGASSLWMLRGGPPPCLAKPGSSAPTGSAVVLARLCIWAALCLLNLAICAAPCSCLRRACSSSLMRIGVRTSGSSGVTVRGPGRPARMDADLATPGGVGTRGRSKWLGDIACPPSLSGRVSLRMSAGPTVIEPPLPMIWGGWPVTMGLISLFMSRRGPPPWGPSGP